MSRHWNWRNGSCGIVVVLLVPCMIGIMTSTDGSSAGICHGKIKEQGSFLVLLVVLVVVVVVVEEDDDDNKG